MNFNTTPTHENYPIKMNRLMLIGNGFDLAHQLKTSYNDFIVWYLIHGMECANFHGEYIDELITVTRTDYYALSYLHHHGLDKVPALVDYYYKTGFANMLDNDYLKIPGYQPDYINPFKFNFKSALLAELLYNCSNANWVDIENTFYDTLKQILKANAADKNIEIEKLNTSLRAIIEYLEKYLSTLDVTANTNDYGTILKSKFNPEEFVGLSAAEQSLCEIDLTMVLNFNYTATIENYLTDTKNSKVTLNYIHGKLGDPDNRLIFGFGDELDGDYASFELDRTKGIFEYIKSFWYFKTSNYHNLIRFIDSNPFQVYILGHSCGLSDRTMLNMIFEHPNCKSIKIYYYTNQYTNNYTTLTQEIARHFHNKQDMRRKIVPFNISSPIPQVTYIPGK